MAFATGYISEHIQLLMVYCAVKMWLEILIFSSTDITHVPASGETSK